MKDKQAVDQTDHVTDERRRRPHPTPHGGGNGDMVYVLGTVGAGVYYWKRADDPKEKAVGVLKALVWPATLVYTALGRWKVD